MGKRFAAVLLLTAIGLAGCGSGPGGGIPATPTALSDATPASPRAATAPTTFVVTLAPQATAFYVTAGVGPGFGLCPLGCHQRFEPVVESTFAADAASCTTAADRSRSCRFVADLPLGTLTYLFLAVDVANGVSEPLALASADETIAAGDPTIPLALQPIFASATLSSLSAASGSLRLAFSDPAGQLIPSSTTQPFADAPTLVDTDPTGQTSLTVGSGAPGATVLVDDAEQPITLNYTPTAAAPDPFTIRVQTAGWSFDLLNPANDYFPQAQPPPSNVPAAASSYGVRCDAAGCRLTPPA